MKKTDKKRKIIPTSAIVIFAVGIIAILLYALAILYTPFADLFNRTVSDALRRVLSFLTGFLPFSLFELMLVCLIPLLVFAVVLSFFMRGSAARVRYAVSLLSLVSLVLTTYIFTFGIAYRTTPLGKKLGVFRGEVDTDELSSVFVLVRDKVNEYGGTSPDGASEMPYSSDVLSQKISESYRALPEDFSHIPDWSSRVKPVIFSPVMSSMGITGIFSPFTGEANINAEYPDYYRPFTVAHEFAHQRGIAREDEANFIAHLVCVSSPDSFIRYSGYLALYEYLAQALYRADKEAYTLLSKELSDTARRDINAARALMAKYSGSTLGKINDKANDIYLKTNGTEGIVSYNLVVLLAVEYYSER